MLNEQLTLKCSGGRSKSIQTSKILAMYQEEKRVNTNREAEKMRSYALDSLYKNNVIHRASSAKSEPSVQTVIVVCLKKLKAWESPIVENLLLSCYVNRKMIS